MNTLTPYYHKFKELETPFYFYDVNALKNTLEKVSHYAKKYNFHIHYALKANSNPKLLKLITSYGLGADCVSGNEILRALECGFSAHKIAFAGVGKTDKEIKTALTHHIFSFNCESKQEIEVINEIAKQQNTIANIALRINPNVDAKTHHYITTGLEENKFGINVWELDEVLDLIHKSSNVVLKGIHFHVGSQITDMSVFKSLCLRINEFQKLFKEKHIHIEHINVGGGLGVNYTNPNSSEDIFEPYFHTFHQHLELLPNQEVHFELGRSIVAQCASLIARVIYVKEGVNTNFAIIDASMTELLRPALYQAYHKIETFNNEEVTQRYDVVGPVCESSDCFAKALNLPKLKRGDLIAIRSVGAYGEVMASQYNLRPLPNAIYSDEF